ncbi:MAG TPA: LysM peptidoglycan-binding domain-containing protein [Streptosporangiaceae bacterium]|nr:LysM peptidoglycan-binding domain-containing protein [Streptosporangiaceae bacterium]
MLEITAYTLTSGQWDPAATPTLGQQVKPATTGSWQAISSQPFVPVAGSLTLLVAQAGQLVVAWDLSLSSPFDPTLTKKNWLVKDIDAVLVVNQGDYAHVWVQLLVTIVIVVQAGQTLDEIAMEAGADLATIAALNRLDSTILAPGQRLLLTRSVLDTSAGLRLRFAE